MNSLFKNILLNLKEIFKISIALVIFVSFFYFRFFLERFPRGLWLNMTEIQLFGVIYTLIFATFYIYGRLQLLGVIKTAPPKNKIFIALGKILIFIARLVSYLLNNLYEKIWQLFYFFKVNPYLGLIKVMRWCSIKNNTKIYSSIIIVFEIFPRIIINFAFFLDVFFFQYLYYSYYCMPVLIMPILIKLLRYVLDHLFRIFYFAFQKCVIVTEKLVNGQKIVNFTFTPELEANPPYYAPTLDDFVLNHVVVLRKYAFFFADYMFLKEIKLKYNWILLSLSIFRWLCLIYMLIIGLPNFI